MNELRLQESSQQPLGAQADQREQEALSDIHMEKSGSIKLRKIQIPGEN